MKKLIVVIFLLLSTTAIADELEAAKTHEDGGHHKHTLALFAGVTVEGNDDLSTLGIEYSFRFHENWTAGGVAERAEREKDSTLLIAFIHFWPYKGWLMGVGAGTKDPRGETEAVYRATIGYEFELGNGWVIAPQANLDVIENHEDEEVYGIAFGKTF